MTTSCDAVDLIGQIKKPEFTCYCCLSAGCASNKQQSISLRCRKIRPPNPEGFKAAKLALCVRRIGILGNWWSRTGSNRRPEACKATALPTELQPLCLIMVGLGRFELPTSPLSGVRSNQLSYRPDIIRTLHIDQSSRITAEPTDRSANQTIALLIREPRLRFQNREGMPGRRARRTRVPRGACCKGKCVEDEGLNPDPTARFLRKEVIQPQVPLRLPCYDFTPVADLTVAGCFLAVSPPSSGKTNSHGVTGGVYKARERIHRGMLIRDY